MDALRWMDGAESGKALKISDVKSEQVTNAVDVHGSSESRIVDLNALYFVLLEQNSPSIVYRLVIWQKFQIAFELAGQVAGLGDSQSEAILFSRASGHVPEFTQNLGSETDSGSIGRQLSKCVNNVSVRWILTFTHPEQDVGI